MVASLTEGQRIEGEYRGDPMNDKEQYLCQSHSPTASCFRLRKLFSYQSSYDSNQNVLCHTKHGTCSYTSHMVTECKLFIGSRQDVYCTQVTSWDHISWPFILSVHIVWAKSGPYKLTAQHTHTHTHPHQIYTSFCHKMLTAAVKLSHFSR